MYLRTSLPSSEADILPQTDEFIASAHYTTGPLSVSLPISSVSLDAPVIQTTKELAEFPYQQDMNAGNPIGVGWTQSTVLNGARSNSNSAYIQAFLSTRPNLTILTGAQATKIIRNGTSGGLPVFRQVQFVTSSGGKPDLVHDRLCSLNVFAVNPSTVTARKEIILAGGSFNSPQLLMLSGIGDKAQLSSLNIPTIVNLPSVGKNMSDHVLLANTFQVRTESSISSRYSPLSDQCARHDPGLGELDEPPRRAHAVAQEPLRRARRPRLPPARVAPYAPDGADLLAVPGSDGGPDLRSLRAHLWGQSS
jgi:choline dehydrogenase-like flavoprotein